MAKFICLTEVCSNTETKQLLLNADRIVHFQMGTKGKDVHVRMDDKTFYFVKESIEDIKRLMGIGLAEIPYTNGNSPRVRGYQNPIGLTR